MFKNVFLFVCLLVSPLVTQHLKERMSNRLVPQRFFSSGIYILTDLRITILKKKLHGFYPQANYTDRATAA
jgi:hypothetical protein